MRLGDICSKIGSGATPRGGKEAYSTSGIPIIRSQNVLDWSFSSNGLAYLNDEQAKTLSNVEVHQGDILLNITGDSVARACIVPSDVIPARVNQHVAILRPKEKANATFILAWLQTNKDLLLKLASSGATRNALTKRMLEGLDINLPSIDIQSHIAELISLIQSKINLNIKLNGYLLELATTRFEQALFKSNRVVRLGDIVKLEDSKRVPLNSRDRDARKGPYPYYGATSIMDYVDDYLFDGIRVLLGEDGSVIDESGRPILQYVWGKYWVNNHAHILAAASDYSLEAIYIALQRTPISHIVTGAVQRKISQRNLNKLKLEMPDAKSLEYLQDIFAAYRCNCEENRGLVSLRDALLPKLMSGEIDVSKIDVAQLNSHLAEY